jgi:hypothetical protein
MNLFPSLPPETRRLLDDIPALIDRTFPLPARFRSRLPADVAELSRLLTSGRAERALSYLGRPNLLSAYLRYFLPWNLYRLCRLLPALDIPLAAGGTALDLGSGPLTLTAALWISRPELRGLPLEFRCVDISGPALEAGKTFFAALAGSGCPWKIHTVKSGVGGRAVQPEKITGGKRAALVCAVNVLNEMYGGLFYGDSAGLAQGAENAARLLDAFAAPSASILVVEPGVPRSGEFISRLRSALLERNRPPVSPCPHCLSCPMPGGAGRAGKNRWCHFAFETEDAPKALRKLSRDAGIPKERAVLSFLLAGSGAAGKESPANALRIVSDSFPLPGKRAGRYGCSARGLGLSAGDENVMRNTPSGTLVNAVFSKPEQRDSKSGALISIIN